MALIAADGIGQGNAAELELAAFSAQTRLLVIAPHPDDETLAAGMLIQRVRAAGGEVKILLLTAGDNNPWPQRWLERRVRIRREDRQRWGQRRHGELQTALQRLDVPAKSLQMLGWPDLGVTEILLHHSDDAIATLAGIITAFQPDIIAMPSLADRHPDHGSAHVLTRLALAGQGSLPRVLTYLIHGQATNESFIDMAGTEAQAVTKLHALAAHVSQTALSGKRMRRLASRPERYVDLRQAAPTPAAALPGSRRSG